MSIDDESEEGEIIDIEDKDSYAATGRQPERSDEQCTDIVELAPPDSDKCFMCRQSLPKYRCPGCDARTCSLTCCKKHKVDRGCDGSVKRSRMIPLANFDNLAMLNDYRFLEEADRLRKLCAAERQQQRASFVKRDGKTIFKLRQECARRGCKIQFLPPYFHRNQSNTSRFDPIADTIFWKIEWTFMDANMLKIESDRIPETVRISTLLKQILYARPTSDYAQFAERLIGYKSVDLCKLRCFMKVEDNGWTRDQRYYELNIDQTLVDAFRDRILVEFPCISVCFSDQSADLIKVLTNEDKNIIMSKRVWERKPTASTFVEKVKLMQDAAKIYRQPRAGNESRNVDNVENVVDATESTLKPLRRLIPSFNRQRFSKEQTAEKINARKTAAEHFKMEKINAIKRLADELAGKNCEIVVDSDNSPISGKQAEAMHARNVNQNLDHPVEAETKSDSIKSEASLPSINRTSKKTVKTAFFGTLGDSDLSLSDSEADDLP